MYRLDCDFVQKKIQHKWTNMQSCVCLRYSFVDWSHIEPKSHSIFRSEIELISYLKTIAIFSGPCKPIRMWLAYKDAGIKICTYIRTHNLNAAFVRVCATNVKSLQICIKIPTFTFLYMFAGLCHPHKFSNLQCIINHFTPFFSWWCYC